MLVSTAGNNNAAYGWSSLSTLTTGSNNTAIGHYAASGITTGANNISLGLSAGGSHTLGDSDNIDIGNPGTSGDDDTIRIGNPTHTRNFQAGIVGVDVGVGLAVVIDLATGQLGVAPIP